MEIPQVMHLRKKFSVAALMTAAAMMSVTGCSGREDDDQDPVDAGSGCTGVCAADSGTDAGTDAGTADAGPTVLSIREARLLTEVRHVTVQNVVVTEISRIDTRNAAGVTADFWVADPNRPQDGIFVQKFRDDPENNYIPAVGDVVTITGFFQNKSRFNDREGYRKVLKNNFDVRGGGAIVPLYITRVSTGTRPAEIPVSIDGGFGNADGGTGRPNLEYLGARVHIAGPLTLTDPNPMAFKRLSAVANDSVHFGFEVSGGVLVNNNSTFGTTQDGGSPRCDWRAQVNADAGTVTFPNGIKGVWDTYTHAPCVDGGTSTFNCFNDAGVVPGTGNNWTAVLYPENCNDLQGQITPNP
jgi:hypothetical protein